MGGQETTLVDVGTLPAKVDQATPAERDEAAQWGSTHSHSVYFAPGADVQRDDDLTDESGRSFRVLATVWPSHPVYLKAECEYRERGI